jgi:N utilization substance protein B
MRPSRRKAREVALQAMYEAEIGRTDLSVALEQALEANPMASDLQDYTRRLVEGIDKEWRNLDRKIAPLVQDYDYERIVTIDKNLMRIAAYEFFHEPTIPPAVSINEAVTIAKKYSTAESGRFVNGVLAALLQESPKANWDPTVLSSEAEEFAAPEPEPEVEEEFIEADSDRAKEVARVAGWRLRGSD